jgi:hypothetical protein
MSDDASGAFLVAETETDTGFKLVPAPSHHRH